MNYLLRPWRESDLESLVSNANNPKIAQFMTNRFPYPYSKEHGANWLKMATTQSPVLFQAITLNDEAIGGIGIHPQQDIMCKNAELGYWLGEKYWGKGIMTKVIPEIIKYGFNTLDINRIYARPFGNNPASQKVLEKCGFQLEARFEKTIFKNGEYQDELFYSIGRKI